MGEIDVVGLAGPELVLVLVVLVADLADDLFEQILDRHQPVHAAIFVDDQRHVASPGLHLLQKHAEWHRGRHIEQRPQQPRKVERPVPAAEAEAQRQILEVHQPPRLIERAGIDRKAGHRARLERGDHVLEARVVRDRDDLGARYADVLDTHASNAPHVEYYLGCAGVCGRRIPGLHRFLRRALGIFAPEQS